MGTYSEGERILIDVVVYKWRSTTTPRLLHKCAGTRRFTPHWQASCLIPHVNSENANIREEKEALNKTQVCTSLVLTIFVAIRAHAGVIYIRGKTIQSNMYPVRA